MKTTFIFMGILLIHSVGFSQTPATQAPQTQAESRTQYLCVDSFADTGPRTRPVTAIDRPLLGEVNGVELPKITRLLTGFLGHAANSGLDLLTGTVGDFNKLDIFVSGPDAPNPDALGPHAKDPSYRIFSRYGAPPYDDHDNARGGVSLTADKIVGATAAPGIFTKGGGVECPSNKSESYKRFYTYVLENEVVCVRARDGIALALIQISSVCEATTGMVLNWDVHPDGKTKFAPPAINLTKP